MPGLPNHFMIFGPYGWTGGTWHQLVETASHHIVRVIGEARRRGATAVEVSEEATERWTSFAVSRLGRSLWPLRHPLRPLSRRRPLPTQQRRLWRRNLLPNLPRRTKSERSHSAFTSTKDVPQDARRSIGSGPRRCSWKNSTASAPSKAWGKGWAKPLREHAVVTPSSADKPVCYCVVHRL